DITGGMAQFDRVLHLYDRERHRGLAVQHGIDPAVVALSYGALLHCFMGAPELARAKSRDAHALAEALGHQHTLAYLLSCTAMLHQLLGEAAATRESAAQALALASEQRFGQWLAWSTVLLGWAQVAEGQGEEGLSALRKGIGMWRAPGALS